MIGYSGHQTSFRKNKQGLPGPMDFPRGPFGGAIGGPPRPAEIRMDAWGRVAQAPDDEQLPYMLGYQSLLMIDQLSPVARPSWEVTNNVTITEERSDRGGGVVGPRFGPRMGPGSPFPGPSGSPMGRPGNPMGRPGAGRPPFGPSGLADRRPGPGDRGAEVSSYDAHERTVYTLREVTGDLIAIKKHYELKSQEQSGAEPRLQLVGDGDLVFDLKAGVPAAMDFRGTLIASRGPVTVRIPITVTYKLVDQPATPSKPAGK